jgi:hypothetical protein
MALSGGRRQSFCHRFLTRVKFISSHVSKIARALCASRTQRENFRLGTRCDVHMRDDNYAPRPVRVMRSSVYSRANTRFLIFTYAFAHQFAQDGESSMIRLAKFQYQYYQDKREYHKNHT